MPANSSFLPGSALQFAWDSTSLGALKTCPRYYYYRVVLGWAPRSESVHLVFGIRLHEAKECYDRQRANGASHDAAVIEAVGSALCATWDDELNRPWQGDDQKNRLTLIRTIVWYFEDYRNDPIQTIILANGKPAVELSFAFGSSYNSKDGYNFILCGHLDRLGALNNTPYICDLKTTKHTISGRFFESFTPHNQFSLYSYAVPIVYSIPAQGLIVDAAQIAVTFSRFERQKVERTPSQLDEWYVELGDYLGHAEDYAAAGRWPMNEQSCGNYGGCAFRRVCSHSPGVREQWLKADFVQRTWDPLRVRGDI
jgi:hypothetical protein